MPSFAITRMGSRIPVKSGGLQGMSRIMTAMEVADFLFRHPIVATQVSATKWAMALGIYGTVNESSRWNDIAYTYGFDPNLGLIPSYGLDVQDTRYGRVLIQAAPNGQIYFNTDVTNDPGNANNPYPGSNDPPEWQGPTLPQVGLGAAGVGLLLLGIVALSNRSGRLGL